MARDFRSEYDNYHASEEQKKNRAMRNAARNKLFKTGKVKKGDGKDVAHRKAIAKGGTNGDGVTVVSKSINRSFLRDKQGNLISETSKRERKKK